MGEVSTISSDKPLRNWGLEIKSKSQTKIQPCSDPTQINTNLLAGTQVLRLVVESHHSCELQLLKALI